MHLKGNAGDPLPTVWNTLEAKGINFLRGQLCLICAAPGVGKSALILAYAVKARVPTFYFSADSDSFTVLTRMLSIETGCPLSESTERVRNQQDVELEDLIRFSFESSPTLENLKTSLESYEEVYGDFPALIVVDNVTNVLTDLNEEDPFAGLEVLMEQLHGLARLTGACVVGLHHVLGQYNDGATPIPLSGIKGQIARVPEVVLTLHRVCSSYGPDSFRVSAVKNRSSKADPSGLDWAALEFDGSRMLITDPK